MTRSAVQSRWLLLAFSTMFAAAGLFWTVAQYMGSWAAWRAYPIQSVGLVVAMIVALGGALIVATRGAPRRWLAAVVLVFAAPTAQVVLRVDMLGAALRLHPPLVVLVLGSIGVVAMGLLLLFTPTPAPHDPIARAVAQPRSSE